MGACPGKVMNTRRKLLVAFGAIVGSVAVGFAPMHAVATPGDCKLARIAEWPVQNDRNRISVQGTINGQSIGILLDTGAEKSLIQRSAAVRLGLTRAPAAGRRMFGVGGETQVEVAYVDELRIGEAIRKNLPILVAGEREVGDNVALLLGADFFENFEIEFDLHDNAVRLHQSRDCGKAWLAYWGRGGTVVLPMESGSRTVLPVKINGETIRALLDSGAATSMLSLDDARRLGVSPETPGVVSGGCRYGVGQKQVDAWIGQFRSFALDNEVIHDPKMYFSDLWQHTTYIATGSNLPRRLTGLPDMLLGADFLRAHRVLISHSQRKVYFTYTGGTVFPTREVKPCGETVSRERPGNDRGKD
jgi:clan AA aspartic protease (TIGR02281 family)